MNKNIKIVALFLLPFFLCSCQVAKDALEGKKRSEQSDEFLVEKKNSLAMPPDFEILPVPGNQESELSNETNSSEIKSLLTTTDENISESNNSEDPASIENTILKKIQ